MELKVKKPSISAKKTLSAYLILNLMNRLYSKTYLTIFLEKKTLQMGNALKKCKVVLKDAEMRIQTSYKQGLFLTNSKN